MILDATSSFDPDQGDRIRYSWKQLSGNKIRLRPNSSSGIVSFEGTPGEYTFELTVTDNYGLSTVITKTVKTLTQNKSSYIIYCPVISDFKDVLAIIRYKIEDRRYKI